MITRKAGPALAAGCTVVVKAPAEAPLTALALAELAHRAGIPAGVVNIITALDNTAEVGKVMTTHPTVKKVSFTGSTGVGRILMNQSSSTIKKLSFELGGNAPFIVFEDADLDKAVKGLIACKFRNSGQTCVCANRILVHRSVYDKFVQMVLDVVKTFVVGDGFGEKTTHGPLIHGRAVSKVAEHVQDAISKGAKLVHGGEPLPQLGPNFFNLTMLTDMKPGMKICDEETFGPVAAFFAFDTEEEAIEIANDSEVGLGGYFFSNNVNRCYRVAEALEVGMVGVNVGVLSDPAAPFGGVKQSGFGREGSKYGIDEFTVTKMVMTDGWRNTQNGGVVGTHTHVTRDMAAGEGRCASTDVYASSRAWESLIPFETFQGKLLPDPGQAGGTPESVQGRQEKGVESHASTPRNGIVGVKNGGIMHVSDVQNVERQGLQDSWLVSRAGGLIMLVEESARKKQPP
ncbi:hypothetical protein NM208_g17240 [Fusarium decemcellulare]|uniref:Uncharacterized protein n=1 Tax=Fusarium decemcellulare TaxID=57161 RepID=A0ACC1R7W6_9HYPO|nr:hypothetical protein NM208_g17240 [Fusarium decemcellulare]